MPPRKTGKVINTVLDRDADMLLRAMLPRSGQGMGLLLSELIRREAAERGKRAQLVQVLRDTASVVPVAAEAAP
jgi:hypothetical protein